MEVRLQKFLAEQGVASRRKAEDLILAGRVTVNGAVVTKLGTKIDPVRDRVVFDGKEISETSRPIYIMLHKPEGVVSTAKDQFGRKTVLDLIHEKERIYPVGRLDYDTSGLLLLTNDGTLTYRLTHPKHDIDKTYIALVAGVPEKCQLEQLEKGIDIEDYRTAPAKVQLMEVAEDNAVLKIIIHEGRNRQVRKMCAAIGHEVLTLKRIAIGRLTLEGVEKGSYRSLTEEETAYLKSL